MPPKVSAEKKTIFCTCIVRYNEKKLKFVCRNRLVDIVNVVAYDLGNTATQRKNLGHHSPTLLNAFGIKQRYNLVSINSQFYS